MNTEALRRQYKPKTVRVLFMGESPPSGGTFFLTGDSRLCASTRAAFERFLGERFPDPQAFLERFKAMQFYLEDLCVRPVDGLADADRQVRRTEGIPRQRGDSEHSSRRRWSSL